MGVRCGGREADISLHILVKVKWECGVVEERQTFRFTF